jgi:TIR domain-containing protein
MSTSDTGTAEHLFVSHAKEDAAIARWLTLKLTAEGYRVWCDEFRLLGGEPYPKDIDIAIKEKTFRMLALLSQHSIDKPNPRKERTLAFEISRKRQIPDFLIPLKLDPAELDWMSSDITYISFQEGWAAGLRQLLKKLSQIATPKSLTNGKVVAAETFLPDDSITATPETLVTNIIPFTTVPETIRAFRPKKALEPDESAGLEQAWSFFRVDGPKFLAFETPPQKFAGLIEPLREAYLWQNFVEICGQASERIVSRLLYRTVAIRLEQIGVRIIDEAKLCWIPPNFTPDGKLHFVSFRNKKTWMVIKGRATLARSDGTREICFHYVAVRLRIRRGISKEWLLQLTPTLYICDSTGKPLDRRVSGTRRRRLTRSWWNHKWLNRLFAFSHVLTPCVRAKGSDVVLDTVFVSLPSSRGIDETALGTADSELEQELEEIEIVDETDDE